MDTTSSSEVLQHRSLNENQCILLCDVPCTAGDNLDKITLEKWESIHEKSLRWKGLDSYQDVYENVDWEKGPNITIATRVCPANAGLRKQKIVNAS